MKYRMRKTDLLNIIILLILSVVLQPGVRAFTMQPQAIDTLTESQFEVNQGIQSDRFSGSASTSIPIEAPPGTAGNTPTLALAYSSGSRNDDLSIIGAGWALTGLSSIERSTTFGTPQYDVTDSFVLKMNGVQNLVFVASDGYYHTESESFMRISYLTEQDYWVLTDKKGTQYRFGFNDDSRSQPTGATAILRWSLDEIKDTHDNAIEIAYSNKTGMVYPKTVTYSVNMGLATYRTVEMNYETHPNPITSYRYGVPITVGERLSYIDVKTDGAMVRRYEMTYSESSSAKESLLSQVTTFGSDAQPGTLGTGTSLPPTKFTYQNGDNQFNNSVWINQPSDNNQTWPADYTGDGRTDLLMCDGGQFKVLESQGSTFTSSNWLSHTCDQLAFSIHDLDGDGKIDIGVWNGNNATFYRSTGTSFSLLSTWTSPTDVIYAWWGDVNGDGKTDLIYCTGVSGQCTTWIVEIFDTNSFLPPSTWYTLNGSYTNIWNNIVDINGDGMVDLVLELSQEGGGEAIYVGLSSGNNFDDPKANPELSSYVSVPKDQWRYGDFNGDGLTDLMILELIDNGGHPVADEIKAHVHLSTGNRFTTGTLWFTQSGIDWWNSHLLTGDFNGDSKTDLASFHVIDENGVFTDHWLIHLSAGIEADSSDAASGLNAPGSGNWGPPVGQLYPAALGDFNGDGKIDRVEYTPSYDLYISLSSGPVINLLQSVQNSLGGKSTNTYRSSSDVNACAINPTYLPMKIQTVCNMTTDDGMGNLSTTTLTYSNGQYDLSKREFRGFGQAETIDPTGTVTRTTFLQSEQLKGMISLVEIEDAQKNLYQKTENIWSFTTPFSDTSIFLPQLDQQDIYTYEGTSTAKQTRTIYQYDAYANPIRIDSLGDLNLNGDERSDIIAYAYNVSDWIISLPNHQFTLDGSSSKLSESWNYYDGATDYSTPPTLGDLTQVCQWLNNGSNPCSTTSFDFYGNQISTTDANGNTSSIAYDTTYQTYPVITTNALNQSVTKTYDGLGRLSTSTDSNGHLTTLQYDPLHRTIAKIIPPNNAAAPTVTMIYDRDGVAPEGTLIQRRENLLSGVIESYSFVDGMGRIIQTKKESPDGISQIAVDTIFNDIGLVESVSVPYNVTPTSEYTAPNTSVLSTSNLYNDPLGRVTKVTYPDGSFTSTFYDKWSISNIDSNGHKVVQSLDAFGRLIQIQEYSGADGRDQNYFGPYSIYANTTYQYDILGQLITTTDALGNITTLVYDTLGRKTALFDPDMGDWRYQYNAVGSLIQQVDAKGQITDLTYDALNRVTSKSFSSTLDSTAPTAPSNLIASANSGATLVNLSWTAATDNVVVDHYRVLRSIDGSTFTSVGNTTTNSFVDTTVALSTTYYYRTIAIDASGNTSNFSNTSIVTVSADTTAPVISAVSVGSIAENSVSISWTTNEPSDSQVEYGTSTSYGSSTVLDGNLVNNHAVNLNGLVASTLYHYRVLSYNAAGNLAISSDFTFTTAAPPSAISFFPASLNFSATEGGANPGAKSLSISNSGGGTLSWMASTSDNWLSLSAYSGSAPSTLNVLVNISTLTAGTYNANIAIASNGASNSPQTIAVMLTINSGGGTGVPGVPQPPETVDRGGYYYTGQYTSIAVDSSGNPHISYYELSSSALKYARWTGLEWQTEIVDNSGSLGKYTSIAIDSSGYAHISYKGQSGSGLKYAKQISSGWDIQVVDSTRVVGEYSSLALDSADRPHITYYYANLRKLKYAKWTGSSWAIEYVNYASFDYTGQYSSLTLDAQDNAHISYYDSNYEDKDLKYVRWTGTNWESQTVDSDGDVGVHYTSIAVDSAGNVHISYYDVTNKYLKYANWNGTNWTTELIDGVSNNSSIQPAIALDGTGAPYISYFSGNPNYDLKLARKTSDGTWAIEVLDGDGIVGGYSDIAFDNNGNFHISYYDSTKKDLKYVTNAPSAISFSPASLNFSATEGGTNPGAKIFKSLSISNSGGGTLSWTASTSDNWLSLSAYSGSAPSTLNVLVNISTLTAGTYNANIAIASNGASNSPQTIEVMLTINSGGGTGAPGVPQPPETVDRGGYYYTGQYTSIAIDANGYPHISYFNNYKSDLMYARWTGSEWQIETIDSSGTVGEYSSIAIDSSGYAHISYKGEWTVGLKYAKQTSSGWDIQVVDSTRVVGEYSSLALDSADRPHITYYYANLRKLKYAKWTGSSWAIGYVDDVPFNYVGKYSSLTLDAEDNAHISYYDSKNKNLKYARWTGTNWENQTVDSIGDVGSSDTSIAVDNAGNVHIIYMDKTNYDIKYANWDGTNWNIEVIDGTSSYSSFRSSIALDGTGAPNISYFDASPNYDLKHARKASDGTWTLQILDSDGIVGGYSDIAIDSDGNFHISYYDETNKDLKYIRSVQ